MAQTDGAIDGARSAVKFLLERSGTIIARRLERQKDFHYLPLHLSEMGRRFGGEPGACPVTEDMSQRIVRLPLFNDLAEDQQARVVDALLRFYQTQPGRKSAMALTR